MRTFRKVINSSPACPDDDNSFDDRGGNYDDAFNDAKNTSNDARFLSKDANTKFDYIWYKFDYVARPLTEMRNVEQALRRNFNDFEGGTPIILVSTG
jgi:hypothetical protein